MLRDHNKIIGGIFDKERQKKPLLTQFSAHGRYDTPFYCRSLNARQSK
jgi:Trm5-related predicted tRNA methylase